MVRALGIEPRTPAWKAGVLPLNYARDTVFIKPERFPIVKVISNHQVSIPNALQTSRWKRADPTRKGHEPMDGLNFTNGKAGSYKKWKLAPAPSQIGYPAAQSHGLDRYSRQPSNRPVATLESPTAADPGQRIRHS